MSQSLPSCIPVPCLPPTPLSRLHPSSFVRPPSPGCADGLRARRWPDARASTPSTPRGWRRTRASSSGPISATSIRPRLGASCRTTFRFHELSVEDAVGSSHHPKVEPYDGYLYLILHGIDWNATQQGGFTTHDIDFFIGPNYLVTVHNGDVPFDCLGAGHLPAQRLRARWRPGHLVHRIVDTMVDNYRPGGERPRGPPRCRRGSGLQRQQRGSGPADPGASSVTSDRCGAW